jgi:hypothetical protein
VLLAGTEKWWPASKVPGQLTSLLNNQINWTHWLAGWLTKLVSVIWGTHIVVAEDSSLLGLYAVSSGKASLDTEDSDTASFETSIIVYQSTWTNFYEGFNLHLNNWVTKSISCEGNNIQQGKKLTFCGNRGFIFVFWTAKRGSVFWAIWILYIITPGFSDKNFNSILPYTFKPHTQPLTFRCIAQHSACIL